MKEIIINNKKEEKKVIEEEFDEEYGIYPIIQNYMEFPVIILCKKVILNWLKKIIQIL